MRKGTARKGRQSKQKPSKKALEKASDARCHACERTLEQDERALFVEEEVGRVFCSEDCIVTYFSPEIERLEQEYFRRLRKNELSGEERERYAELRWKTLQNPSEIWREKTLSGDFRFTLISPYADKGGKTIWNVCLTLFLRGEPSFLYLAFVTQDSSLIDHYRRGERLRWKPVEGSEREGVASASADRQGGEVLRAGSRGKSERSDGLASPFTAEEMLRVRLLQARKDDDIPLEEFSRYERYIEVTLQGPDEVWTFKGSDKRQPGLFHFMRNCGKEEGAGIPLWYIVVARETDDDEHIEILDAFPTRDVGLVESYRCGNQEIGHAPQPVATGRFVH